jgi:hypothetical protein
MTCMHQRSLLCLPARSLRFSYVISVVYLCVAPSDAWTWVRVDCGSTRIAALLQLCCSSVAALLRLALAGGLR